MGLCLQIKLLKLHSIIWEFLWHPSVNLTQTEIIKKTLCWGEGRDWGRKGLLFGPKIEAMSRAVFENFRGSLPYLLTSLILLESSSTAVAPFITYKLKKTTGSTFSVSIFLCADFSHLQVPVAYFLFDILWVFDISNRIIYLL